MEQHLDSTALVHRPLALGGLLERQLEVEDLARTDGPVPDQVDEFGEVLADGGGSAVQVHVGEEQLLAGQCDVVRDADVPEVAAGTSGSGGWAYGG
jgi:hypothetical protein